MYGTERMNVKCDEFNVIEYVEQCVKVCDLNGSIDFEREKTIYKIILITIPFDMN